MVSFKLVVGSLLLHCLVALRCISATPSKPNILFIMADDLNADWKNDRLGYMPNLNKYFKQGGTFFAEHVAAVPVCGPSRSSFLLGRYPHNGGYYFNGDMQSIKNYKAQQNHTLGKWLTDSGYHTAFLGKYVNNFENTVSHGWSHWGGFVNTYDFYNASVHDMDWADQTSEDPPLKINVMTGVHQADFLGNLTLTEVKKAVAKGLPFFVSVTPVMPHWGTCYGPNIPQSSYAPTDPHFEWNLLGPDGVVYSMPISPCPSVRHKHKFDGMTNPHIPEIWNKTISGPRPAFMTHAFETIPGHLVEFQAEREDVGWRNRSASLLDLDDLIGDIMSGLESMDMLQTTIAFFTSDNGYHLGEHKMPFGKGEPYETDVRLPMYVRGPSLPQGATFSHPTNHLDITATIVEFAKASAAVPTPLDGKSFVGELINYGRDTNADAWRQYSFSEFFDNNNTWQLVRVVNSTHKFSYVRWCTDDTEVFNLNTDQWQTANLAGTPGFAAQVESQYNSVAAALGKCGGANCSDATLIRPGMVEPLRCYDQKQSYWSAGASINPGVSQIHGWVVDSELTTPANKPAGWAPVKVRLLLDQKIALPDQIANVSRPDIVAAHKAPNPNHGFVWNLPKGFVPTTGFHAIKVRGIDPFTNLPTQIGTKGDLQFCFKDGKTAACL
eukprot:m.163845 g.163845  ORF g.163845 m.163845 type:complete len:665 (-) comp31309_c1_seq1:74-2068(-)